MARLAEDLGLERLLMLTDPEEARRDHRTTRLKSMVGSMLEVLREVRVGADTEGDEKLVASWIRSADEALNRFPEGEGRVLARASAPLVDLAAANRDVAGGVSYHLIRKQNQKENEHANRNTETVGDSSAHSQLPSDQRLFPDDAGDWGPPAIDQGHRLRTRRSPRKKRVAAAGPQAQGSLFTSF
jgi:hypothetical protein